MVPNWEINQAAVEYHNILKHRRMVHLLFMSRKLDFARRGQQAPL
jgi:hypothetical protein